MATITVGGNNVYGIVILPDNSSLSINNTYSDSDWAANMEANGAVFLPTAGVRSGSTVSYVGGSGNYWSKTPAEEDFVKYLYFPDDGDAGVGERLKYFGCSVRLVRSVD